MNPKSNKLFFQMDSLKVLKMLSNKDHDSKTHKLFLRKRHFKRRKNQRYEIKPLI